jgi:DNA-binding XRE family transcriptional regulator
METISVEYDLMAREGAAASIHRLLETFGSSYLDELPTPGEIARIASFGDALRDMREDKGLSQDELGKMLGMSRMGISRLELSQKLPREARHALHIAATLNCDTRETAAMLRSFTIDRLFTIVMELESNV